MKSDELLKSFTDYCQENPELRFWQALRNWCNWNYIYVYDPTTKRLDDTFYWEENKEPGI